MAIIKDPTQLEMPQGLSLLNGEKAICARGGCLPSSYWCRNCKLPPDFLAFLDTHQARDRHEVIVSGNRIKSFNEAELKKWRVVDASGKYVPYDANWINSFPELKTAQDEQVRLKQEKIIQSKENQQIMFEEPIKEKSIALGALSLIALVIGGFLVLR